MQHQRSTVSPSGRVAIDISAATAPTAQPPWLRSGHGCFGDAWNPWFFDEFVCPECTRFADAFLVVPLPVEHFGVGAVCFVLYHADAVQQPRFCLFPIREPYWPVPLAEGLWV